MPAFATSTSIAPKSETAAAIESGSATSAASSPERDTRPTSHPRAANAFATAWPIPREAPVTSTRVPGPICTPGTLPASLYDWPMSQDHATVAEEEYLQIIYWLQEAGLPITDGYIARGPDKRLTFTDTGHDHATQIVRRHRLIERFLTDVFDIPWDQVHEEAERLEHWMSPVVEERMLRAIGDAKTCPHGHPIFEGEREQGVPLADVEIGASVRVLRFENEAEDLLHYLKDSGLHPGLEGKLARAGDDEIVLQSAGSSHAITRSVAETVSVRADPSPPARTALPDQLVLGKERYGR